MGKSIRLSILWSPYYYIIIPLGLEKLTAPEAAEPNPPPISPGGFPPSTAA